MRLFGEVQNRQSFPLVPGNDPVAYPENAGKRLSDAFWGERNETVVEMKNEE